jgi:drug/metabolite transporter superfamily protein YnfA
VDQRPSLMSEFWLFLKQNKKWWILPILLVILLLGILALMSASPLAPFIYALF